MQTRVSEYLGFIMTLIFAFGVCFQLPVVLTLLARIDLVTSQQLGKGRRYAIVVILALAAFLTPPDPISQIGLSLPMYALYELSILSVKWVERQKAARLAAEAANSEALRGRDCGMRSSVLTLKRARRLRREMTLPEIVLWPHLRGRALAGLHFRHQHPIGPYILDFYCASARLCVEIDGAVHNSIQAAQHDERRTAWLTQENIRVLRFAAADVLNDETLGGVLAAIQLGAAPSTA